MGITRFFEQMLSLPPCVISGEQAVSEPFSIYTPNRGVANLQRRVASVMRRVSIDDARLNRLFPTLADEEEIVPSHVVSSPSGLYGLLDGIESSDELVTDSESEPESTRRSSFSSDHTDDESQGASSSSQPHSTNAQVDVEGEDTDAAPHAEQNVVDTALTETKEALQTAPIAKPRAQRLWMQSDGLEPSQMNLEQFAAASQRAALRL